MLIRKLHAHERGLYSDHLKRLPEHDRRMRFAGGGVNDSSIDAYVAGIGDDDLILGVVEHDRVVGAVHVAINGSVAEIGISVDADHRAGGVGRDLLTQAVAFARNRRAEKLYTLCLSDNRSMVALARRSGMELHCDAGEAEAFLDLPPPDPITVTQEAQAGLFAMFHDWAEMVEAYGDALTGGLLTRDQESKG
ncbi:histone acetyltransferase [Paramagnetospirillum marisnigri]|uniref:Histone acetyltransferase n=1 Tax=Paramagnetospirillum marisnigri TaxID=1285242 RepID=A0A178MPB2_9PROT|nr:GNAT family N-acetyltransferase [Paramagnetospirillum marisnigri]OAN50652.1 histone acetyltransferase [Paramagnetospirillum marisnigri]